MNVTKAAVNVLLLGIFFSTVVGKQFYQTNHFGVFKELAQHIVDWKKEVRNDALLVGDFNYPFYINYYIKKKEATELALYRTTDKTGLAELKSLVDTCSNEFLIYSWSTVNQVAEVEAIILEKFPIEVKRETYFNSEVVMFQTGSKSEAFYTFNFEKSDAWNFNPEAITADSLGRKNIIVSSQNPYGPTLQVPVSELIQIGASEIIVRVNLAETDFSNNLQMVFDQGNENGGYAWESDAFQLQFKKGGPNWSVFSYNLKDVQSDTDVLKVYPWLPEGDAVSISSMEVMMR